MPAGRPLKFATAEELETKINGYFDDCDKEYDNRVFKHDEIIQEGQKRICTNCSQDARTKGCLWISGERKEKRPYTVSGLALWLDTTRQTLLDYQERDEFFDTITRAKQRIENFASEKLFDPKAPTKGIMFSLSNNSDRWAEKKATEMTVKKDSAAALTKRLFDGDEDDDDTLINDERYDSSASKAEPKTAQLDSVQAKKV